MGALSRTPIAAESFRETPRSGNFIRSTWNRLEPIPEPIRPLIDVRLESAGLLEIGHKGDRLVGRTRAELRDDIDHGTLDVLGPALGIAADVDVGALGKPGP